MALEILTFTLGPLDNNSYVIVDPVSQTAALIDPSFDSEDVVQEYCPAGFDSDIHLDHTCAF